MSADRSSWCALVVSLVVHAALAVTTVALVAGDVTAVAAAEQPGLEQSDGVWAGDTFDIDGLVDGEPGRGRAAEAAKPEPPATRTEPAAPAKTGASPEPEPVPALTARAALPVTSPVPSSIGPAAAASGVDREPPPHAQRQTDSPKAQGGASPSTEAGTGEGSGGQGPGRSYGAASERRGLRVLAPAFARAIPAAVSADPVWSRLPLGPAGRLEITITLNDDGKIVEVPLPENTPSHLRAIVERTMALLRAGRFALTGATGAGAETLRIEVTLSQQDPIEHDSAKPSDALRLGHQPPTADEPGRAHFTLASGRHFEALITVLASAARHPD